MFDVARLHSVVGMLEQPIYAQSDVAALRALIEEYAWVTMATLGPDEVTVSHLPVILDPIREDLTVLGHLAAQDAELHELGKRSIVLIIQGPHGYISPLWYEAEPFVPTWNFVVAHLHGRPELLGPEATYQVLEQTCDQFEARHEAPWRLDSVSEYAAQLAPYTAGFRLTPTRVVGKAKLSQDKPRAIVDRVIKALDRNEEPYANPTLASAMRTVLGA